jgi:hypothetical protein
LRGFLKAARRAARRWLSEPDRAQLTHLSSDRD